MEFSVRQRVQRRLREEKGCIYKAGARCHLALVYPNRYFFGMSNLGFQTMYKIFNEDPEVACERMFLPEQDILPHFGGGSLLTYESQSSAGQMDAIAFSVSYQNDLLHILPLLRMMGLPPRADERGPSDPIVLAGGPALTINPEPAALIFDAVVIGEGEEVAQEILEVLKSGGSREEKLQALSQLEGIYVPLQKNNSYEGLSQGIKPNGGFGLVSGEANGSPGDFPFIRRLVVRNPRIGLGQTQVVTRDTEFGDMFLIEVQRGCQWGCRFCAAGFMYRYPVYDSLADLKRRIDIGLGYRNKIGLIAGDLLGHDSIHEILSYIDAKGGGFSPSSVRLNAFTPTIIHFLKKSGNRSIAIAPEAGSERLRRKLNKTFTQEEVVAAAAKLAEGGIENIKLYIMIGLPTETEEDIEELCDLTLRTRQALSRFAKKSGRMPQLTLSVSPFVPKPSTPMQYEAFAGMKPLKGTFQKIRKRLIPQGHINLSGESALDATVETLLSRGDRRVYEFLEAALVPAGKAWQVGSSGHLKTALKKLSFDYESFVTRPWKPEAATPWDFIDHGMKESYFQRERDKFSRDRITPYCRPQVCRSCGVC